MRIERWTFVATMIAIEVVTHVASAAQLPFEQRPNDFECHEKCLQGSTEREPFCYIECGNSAYKSDPDTLDKRFELNI